MKKPDVSIIFGKIKPKMNEENKYSEMFSEIVDAIKNDKHDVGGKLLKEFIQVCVGEQEGQQEEDDEEMDY